MSGNRFAMVSEWMAGGNINAFVEANTNVDRLGLVCISLEGFIFTFR